MFRLRDISIKRKLTAIIMAASTVAMLFVVVGFAAYEFFTFRETMTRSLGTQADGLANRSTAALTFHDKKEGEEILGSLRENGHIVVACLYDGPYVLAQYPTNASAASFPHPEKNGLRFEKNRLVMFREVMLEGNQIGTVYLVSDLEELYDRLKSYAAIAGMIALASFMVTYVLSMLLQRIVSRPISHLVEATRIVSEKKNYSTRAHKHGNDELGQLIDGFNGMLAQIQQRDAALQDSNDDLEKRVWSRTQDLRGEIEERQRAEASLQNQFARISLLNQITQAISERQDTESILYVVLRQLEDHLHLDLGCVTLFYTPPDTLNVAALRVKNPLLANKLDLHEGAVQALADTGLQQCKDGLTLYMPDTQKASAALMEQLAVAGLRSAVAVPLLVENKLFGVLLGARLKPDSFSSGDCEFLRSLAEHVALAAHQARLHHEVERAYNELRQTQQTVMQQERLKALGQMASGIAHDVNNALSPVVGFADLMLRGEPGLSANGKKYLKHIRTAGEDIAHIVARLKEFYRQREDTEFLQEVNLNTLAEQVVDMTRPRWRDIPQSRGITVEVQTDLAKEVPNLLGIESEIREALTNLVINAVDALPNGGKVFLRSRIVAGDEKHATYVLVDVTDTGIGMTEDTRKRCLEPFFSTKGKRGTGLGLAMVYGVMERHDGKIEIESQLGKGTTFRLVFPVRKGARQDATVDDLGPAPEPLEILCIDDEPLVRDLLKDMLERDGHRVETSDGGQNGLETFRAARQKGRPFDVIITDLGMPYIDGRQVVKVVKNESPSTPVVMLTGWGAFMKEEGDAPAQVDGVLSKPPRSKELRQTLCRFHPAKKVAAPK